jgi:hypothetical protein
MEIAYAGFPIHQRMTRLAPLQLRRLLVVNTLELAKDVKKLSEAATPGPWETHNHLPKAIYQAGERGYLASAVDSDQDAEFIAHSRTAVPQLADAVIEMVEVLKIYGNTANWKFGEFKLDDDYGYARALLTKLGITTTEGGE